MPNRDLRRGPVAQGLVHPLRLVPVPVRLPPRLRLDDRGVGGPVDLLGLVVPEEALDVRLVLRALDAGVLQGDVERVGRRPEVPGHELTAPINPKNEPMPLGDAASEPRGHRILQRGHGLDRPAPIAEPRAGEPAIVAIHDGEQVPEAAPTPDVRQIHLPVLVAGRGGDHAGPRPALALDLPRLESLQRPPMPQDRLPIDPQAVGPQSGMHLAVPVDAPGPGPRRLDGHHEIRIQRPGRSRLGTVVPAALGQSCRWERLGQRRSVLLHQAPHQFPLGPNAGIPANFFWASMMRAWAPASSRSRRSSSWTGSRCLGLRWSLSPSLPRSRKASRHRYTWAIATPCRWQRAATGSWPWSISNTSASFSSGFHVRRDAIVASVCLDSILSYSPVQFKRGAFHFATLYVWEPKSQQYHLQGSWREAIGSALHDRGFGDILCLGSPARSCIGESRISRSHQGGAGTTEAERSPRHRRAVRRRDCA